MAGYWPIFFPHVYELVHKHPKRTRSISSQLDRTSLGNKGFFKLYMASRKFFPVGTQRVIPNRQHSVILLIWVANQRAGFGSSQIYVAAVRVVKN